MPEPVELLRARVPALERPTSVARFLEKLGLSNRLVRRLKVALGISVNGEVVRATHLVQAGDEVVLRLPVREAPGVIPEPIPVAIVYEDADLLVVNKPPGLVVHPTRGATHATLANGIAYLFRERGERAGIHPVHRIDADTSGLVLFAKNPLAHQRLDEQLRAHKLDRHYLALVWGRLPDAGVIDQPIALAGDHPVARTVAEHGQRAVTNYAAIAHFARPEPEGTTLVRLRLETGRTHQIRVHLADAGHRLVGDTLYGGDRPALLPRQALHAETLAFAHPRDGRSMTFEAPLPDDLAALLAALAPAD
ncbi:MAG TPA: RluA family pseudouridine synthase [Oscillatoriaceae cyanobacterium]